MTHHLGRFLEDGRTFTHTAGIDFVAPPGPLGPARFIILHFDNVILNGSAKLTVDLGYAQDVFSAASGSAFWTRAANPVPGPIRIRITGGTGSARLQGFGSGEQSITPGNTPGTSTGSQSNPDVFLHDATYLEPIYETRLECNPGFAWRNAKCTLPTISDSARNKVAAATGIIVEVHDGHVSSCSGTLIAADLFMTARHCLTDPSGEDRRSASVTFDYATSCDSTHPGTHVTRFFKVLEEVAFGSPPTGSNPPASTDWVVLRLDAAPGALPPPLHLRETALMTGETIFTMHHPNGAAKKTQAGVHDGGSISGFDYAGGSSGSALFDVNGDVVGGPLASGAGCGVTYAPVAPIRSALTNPPAPPVPLDVMIVFDRSGSMGSTAPPAGRTKLAEAQDAASLFVQLVREGAGDRLGLVTFSSMATLVRGLAPAAAAKPVLVGPAPFTSGDVGAITAGGSTSIGAGVGISLFAYSGSNDRAMLLLTDGLQNTDPMIEEIEGSLGGIKLNVIGLGSDADIDGPLLDRLARQHDGHFTRATDGLALRKFFGVAFGNIFESGALIDPDFVLRASQAQSSPHRFTVCGEERLTIILSWDDPAVPLRGVIRTPSGKVVAETRRFRPVRGRTWVFWRVPLPFDGERDGTWTLTVERVPVGGEFPPEPKDERYMFLVVCAGGPKLVPLSRRRRYYTGDTVHPLVALHYGNRTTPHHAEVELTIQAPKIALGELVMKEGLHAPVPSADSVSGFHATLQAIARRSGGALPVASSTTHVRLFDDGAHEDGAMEPDGVFNHPMKDLTRVEGTYQFRAVATYGEGCVATREAHWSVHVEPGIDPDRSDVILTDVDGARGTLVITPRDRYDNPLGPGRGDRFTVSPLPGVVIDGKVKDNKDGSYSIVITWDGGATPGIVVQQPDRKPVPVVPTQPIPAPCPPDCTDAASKLLDCLGLEDSEVKRVRVKKVCLEVDLKDPKDCC